MNLEVIWLFHELKTFIISKLTRFFWMFVEARGPKII